MNVLLLTPDRVGSTLLQRLLTVYMLRKGFDKPVVNLHELTNGLVKYYNTFLSKDLLGKPQNDRWGYYQSLDEIVNLLDSVDHYKTSRLAYYHLQRRQDSTESQQRFYKYLNENFYIISCHRTNLFEYALSWVIQEHSRRLNVYSVKEKVGTFESIYRNGITASQDIINQYLDNYLVYERWTKNFNVRSEFNYDLHANSIENYILGLDFMQGGDGWKSMFGQEFEQWNACHRMIPNLLLGQATNATNTLSLRPNFISELKWLELKGADWPDHSQIHNIKSIPSEVQQDISRFYDLETVDVCVDQPQLDFLNQNLKNYFSAGDQIQGFVATGLLVSNIPVKLQSLNEKKQIIKNFDECVGWYNQWARKNNQTTYNEQTLQDCITKEEAVLSVMPKLN